jgi:hypothetical protein
LSACARFRASNALTNLNGNVDKAKEFCLIKWRLCRATRVLIVMVVGGVVIDSIKRFVSSMRRTLITTRSDLAKDRAKVVGWKEGTGICGTKMRFEYKGNRQALKVVLWCVRLFGVAHHPSTHLKRLRGRRNPTASHRRSAPKPTA